MYLPVEQTEKSEAYPDKYTSTKLGNNPLNEMTEIRFFVKLLASLRELVQTNIPAEKLVRINCCTRAVRFSRVYPNAGDAESDTRKCTKCHRAMDRYQLRACRF